MALKPINYIYYGDSQRREKNVAKKIIIKTMGASNKNSIALRRPFQVAVFEQTAMFISCKNRRVLTFAPSSSLPASSWMKLF